MKTTAANKKEKNTVGNNGYNGNNSHSVVTACSRGRSHQLKKEK